MKNCINAWSVKGDASFEEMFRDVKNAGFDGIELNVDRSGAHSLTEDITDEALAEIKALSDKYALPVVSISTSLWGGCMAEDGNRAREVLIAQLRCAKALGAGGILIVPGGNSDARPLREAYKACLQNLSALTPEIDKYGLKVGVENVWNGFFSSPFDMARFIDEIGHPLVGAYYDIGNTIAFSRTEDWIEILGERIQHTHIKGFKRNRGIHSGGIWCNIAESSVDWTSVKKTLQSIGYTGTVTAEVGKTEANQTWEDYYAMVKKEIDVIVK